MSDPVNQQDYLRSVAAALGLSQKAFAERMGTPWATFEKWLMPTSSGNYREMPPTAWQLAREILAHETLKKSLAAVIDTPPNGR
jgi:hypothetical protein